MTVWILVKWTSWWLENEWNKLEFDQIVEVVRDTLYTLKIYAIAPSAIRELFSRVGSRRAQFIGTRRDLTKLLRLEHARYNFNGIMHDLTGVLLSVSDARCHFLELGAIHCHEMWILLILVLNFALLFINEVSC